MGGARLQCGRIRAQLVPSFWYAQNRPFPVLTSGRPNRSGFASPFHSTAESSADLPLRFGSRPLLVADFGQTSAELDAGPLTVGVGTEAQWWGPGIRNALVMSNHAAGVPSAYLRTRQPAATPVGFVEARWLVGGLIESPYFDTDGRNDMRSISGLIVALRPSKDTNLTVGAARVVYAAVPGIGALPARFLDAVARWGEGGNLRNAQAGRAAEQLTAAFARRVFAGAGVETYAEWARVIIPASIRSLLVAPQFTQGYTLGTQWLGEPNVAGAAWRAQVEFTMLEQPLVSRATPAPSFYLSPVVPQGYTNRGQTIGASIGPGSQSQWFAVDRIGTRRRLGVFIGRIRWENDDFYRQQTGFDRHAHDVSLYGGIRAAKTLARYYLTGELVAENRLNYLFQNQFVGFEDDTRFDVHNVSLRFSLSPRVALTGR